MICKLVLIVPIWHNNGFLLRKLFYPRCLKTEQMKILQVKTCAYPLQYPVSSSPGTVGRLILVESFEASEQASLIIHLLRAVPPVTFLSFLSENGEKLTNAFLPLAVYCWWYLGGISLCIVWKLLCARKALWDIGTEFKDGLNTGA